MGIFDNSIFDPQTYSGGMSGFLQSALQSGLLGRALPQQADAPTSMGSYGGVPYPIYGSAPPQSAALPPAAQPIQYQAPQSTPLPTQLQAPFGGNLGAGIQGFLNGGSLPQAIGNAVQGFATGQRSDPAGLGQQTAQATYQALLKAGIPDGVAQAAALNPEVLKTIAPQIYSKPKAMVVPGVGGSQVVFADEGKQTINGVPVSQQNGAGANSSLDQINGKITQLRQSGASLNDMLQVIPPSLRAGVAAMLQGGAIPSNLSFRGDARNQAVLLAHTIDPTFDETMIEGRRKMAADASMGTVAKTNNALNTGIGHIVQLADAVQNLGNTNYTPVNWVKNLIGPMFGGTGVTNFEAIKNRVAPEITRIWRGAGGAEADIARDLDNLSNAKTPAQLYGAIAQIAGLMRSKIEANQKQYSDAMGPYGRDPDFMISKENRTALDRVEKLAGGGAPQTGGSIPKVSSVDEARKLPRGSHFIDPNGVERIVP